jgi:uncharacterized protein with von Willebrand factor type A (vWA) domain
MNNLQLPFYSFFDALRKNGFSLGIAEYYLLLEALHLGLDKNYHFDKGKMLKICQTLWLKPNQSKFLFENLFEENFENISNTIEETPKVADTSEQENPTETLDNQANREENKIKKEKEEKEKENTKNENSTTTNTNNFAEKDEYSRVKWVMGKGGEKIAENEDKQEKETPKRVFFADYFFDIKKRQMQQVCRFLPMTQNVYATKKLSIENTVNKIAENGGLIKPVFETQKKITNKVLLLIDHEGSMLAFEKLADVFAEALQDAFETHKIENKKTVSTYYFYNVPAEYCYKNKAHTEYDELKKVIGELGGNSSVIIISDGGAARGNNSDARFKATLRFIFALQKKTSKIVWLNPMKKTRWEGTTARRIKRFVEMASLTDQQNLQQAINILRGK